MKLFFGENKKVLSSMGIYLTILVIIAVVILSGFYYKPNTKARTLDIKLSSVEEAKEKVFEDCKTAIKYSNNIIIEYKNLTTVGTENLLEKISNTIESWNTLLEDNTQNNLDNLLQSLINLKNQFKNDATSGHTLINVDNRQSSTNINYTIKFLITEKSYNSYMDYIDNICENILTKSVGEVKYLLTKNNFVRTLENIPNDLYTFSVDSEFLDNLSKTVEKSFEFYDIKYNEINSKILNNEINEDLLKYLDVCYFQTMDSYKHVLQSILVEGLSQYSDVQISKFLNFTNKNINLYELKEENVKNNYIITNLKSYADYSYISNGENSSNISSIYDFVYITTEICFIAIIIFMIFLCSYTICGEIEKGTMKTLLIRPYKRWKILLSKILSCLFISATLLIISYLASLFGGILLKLPKELSPALVVFNAKKIFTTSQLILSILHIISLFIQISIICIGFITISMFAKKEIYSIGVCSFVGIIILISNMLNAKFLLLNILPTSNISLYKFLGGASNLTKLSIANMVMTPPIEMINFYVTIAYILFITILLNVVIFRKFKRMDIK